MIDFHSHILPGIDDGAKNENESFAMLKLLKSQSVERVVATPHFYSHRESPEMFVKRRKTSLDLLNNSKEDLQIEIIPGAEVMYFEGISRCDDLSLLKIKGTDCILLEMPFRNWNSRLIDEVIELNECRDVNVVLAHIERYLRYIPKNTLNELIIKGISVQSNADFFLNPFTKRKALNMLKNGQIHLLGSDCHNTKERAPEIGKAQKVIFDKLGESAVKLIDNFSEMLLDSGVIV